ncbi:MAG: histidine-type phosphatase [Prevotellaceae bacterium]|nr:histidine-type phosphatase [Prevotellaceae bacterium]
MKLPKRLFVSALALCMGVVAQAQQAREDFAKDITLSGAQNKAYPGPQKQLSPALEGYTPYYISHYGRHGSRYMIGKNDYDRPYDQMKKAADAGMLTEKGIEVMEKVRQIRDEAKGRDSELTPLGAQQHRDIAKRMYVRFPEVFKGKTHIDAKSTTVIRCILSMENALQQLIALNPELTVTHDASAHDMYYMNFQDSVLIKQRIQGERSPELWKSNMKYDNGERVVDLLFKDKNFLKENKIDGKRLVNKIFDLATSLQNTELRDKIDLFDIFNLDEVYNYWAGGNAWWYVAYGNSPLSGGNQAFSQRNLVKKIISEADSCLAFPHPGATLRFGHDQMVMPLACLLNINGYGKQMSLDELANSDWINYRIFPMACNVQFIFYHKNDNDKDVIFKVLLNEDEAVLPDLKPFKGCYYKWSDFKDFFLKKINDYEKK